MGFTALVVDDDVAICDLVTLLLSLENFEAVTATDAESALDLAARIRPDVIVLDIMMPDVDGWHVAERLKNDAGLVGVPVVFCSALKGDEDIWAGWRAGAASYVTKPFDPEHLVSEVLRVVRTAAQT